MDGLTACLLQNEPASYCALPLLKGANSRRLSESESEEGVASVRLRIGAFGSVQ